MSPVPVRSWAKTLSPETRRQLERLAAQPYVVGFVAAMADAHLSDGVAVGSVFATETRSFRALSAVISDAG